MTDAIIKFGRHKGLTIEEILHADAPYLEWLSSNAEIMAKNPDLKKAIQNLGASGDQTPDHNALQAKFLDDDLCLRLALIVTPIDTAARLNPSYSPFRDYVSEAILKVDAEVRKALPDPPSSYRHIATPEYAAAREAEEENREARKTMTAFRVEQTEAEFEALRLSLVTRYRQTRREMEPAGGGDIYLSFQKQYQGERNGEPFILVTSYLDMVVEVKPSISDDYPSVLRQVKVQRKAGKFRGNSVVVTHAYTGVGATLAQVRQMFAESDVTLVLMEELA